MSLTPEELADHRATVEAYAQLAKDRTAERDAARADCAALREAASEYVEAIDLQRNDTPWTVHDCEGYGAMQRANRERVKGNGLLAALASTSPGAALIQERDDALDDVRKVSDEHDQALDALVTAQADLDAVTVECEALREALRNPWRAVATFGDGGKFGGYNVCREDVAAGRFGGSDGKKYARWMHHGSGGFELAEAERLILELNAALAEAIR